MPLSARVEEGVTLVELEVGDVKRSYAAGVAQGRRADDAGGVAHRKADGSTHCIGGAQGSGGDWGVGGDRGRFFRNTHPVFERAHHSTARAVYDTN